MMPSQTGLGGGAFLEEAEVAPLGPGHAHRFRSAQIESLARSYLPPVSTMQRAKLPITGPCPIDLDAIGFDRRAKTAHCAHCDKSVHNLSNMTRAEAKQFLRDHAGQKLCVSYRCTSEGQIRFAPDASAPADVVPVARLRTSTASRAAAAVAGMGLAAALAACTPHDNPEVRAANPEPEEPIVVEPPDPEPIPLAGAAQIPEPEVIDGEVPVPEDLSALEGEIAVPEVLPEPEVMMAGEAPVLPEEPCDAAAKPD